MAIIIQAGHIDIEQNCDHGLRTETGAPGEREYNATIAGEVAGALNAHGLTCIVADANANCDPQITRRDYDAVIALHCDGRNESGFSCNTGLASEDGAAAESLKLASALKGAYAATGLTDLSARFADDPNITQYYLFRSLTPATSFVLLEMGAIAGADGGHGPDYEYLETHAHDVAAAIVVGVLQFLAQPDSPVAPPSEAPGSEPPSTPEQPVQPPATSTNAAALTNLGQTLVWLQEISTNVAAAETAIHAARKSLGGE